MGDENGRPVEPDVVGVTVTPIALEIQVGFQDDQNGTHRSVVAQISGPGFMVLGGFTRDYAKALGEALVEHAGRVSALQVPDAALVDHLGKGGRPR